MKSRTEYHCPECNNQSPNLAEFDAVEDCCIHYVKNLEDLPLIESIEGEI